MDKDTQGDVIVIVIIVLLFTGFAVLIYGVGVLAKQGATTNDQSAVVEQVFYVSFPLFGGKILAHLVVQLQNGSIVTVVEITGDCAGVTPTVGQTIFVGYRNSGVWVMEAPGCGT